MSEKIEEHAYVHSFISERATLRFLSAGDPHGDVRRVQNYLKECIKEKDCSFIIFMGDYQADPEKDYARAKSNIKSVLGELKRLYDKTIFVLGGNYELPGVTTEASLEIGRPFYPLGCPPDSLNDRTYPGNFFRLKDNITFIGVDGTNPINQRFPGERSESELEWALERAAERASSTSGTIILVTHAPPYNCGSRDSLGAFGLPSSYWGKHVGSIAIRNFLMKRNVLLHVCGHVHEGVGASMCTWNKNGAEFDDLRMGAYEIVLFAIDKKNIGKATLCVNHGTLEFWNYFKFQLAETDNYILLEVQKRRLGGEDFLTKITNKLSLGRQFKYTRTFFFNVTLEKLIREIRK